MLKNIFLICSFFLISSCASQYRISPGAAYSPLKPDEGYLGFVINTLDPLRSIQLSNTESGSSFYVGRVDQGTTQITLKVSAGEYCFIGFDVYDLRVDYKDQGFCTYVEAGEMNYFSEFFIRKPVTSSVPNFPRFVRLLRKDHLEICKEYINDECKL